MSAGLIFKQISKVMSDIDAIGKNRDNKSQGFKFRGIDDVMNELHPAMRKHGIFIVPEVLEEKREERATKTGGVMTYVILKIKYTFFAEDGSNVSAIMVGEGSDTGDKASNKAQSVALKYACLQVFAIPTEDEKDPDFESPSFAPRTSEPKTQPAPPPKVKTFDPASKKVAVTYVGGEYVVKTKKYKERNLTIAELCAEIGKPALQKYIGDALDWCEERGLQPGWEIRELYENAKIYFAELERLKAEANPPSNDWQNEEWPEAK